MTLNVNSKRTVQYANGASRSDKLELLDFAES